MAIMKILSLKVTGVILRSSSWMNSDSARMFRSIICSVKVDRRVCLFGEFWSVYVDTKGLGDFNVFNKIK